MKTFAKLGYLAAACALLVATFSIVGPRVVRAAIATLIRDADHPARHPFKLSCFNDANSTNTSCTLHNLDVSVVPAGQEYVIQGVSVHTTNTPQTGSAEATVQATTGSDLTAVLVPLTDQGPLNAGQRDSAGVLRMPIYADPGTVVTCGAFSPGATHVSVLCMATGYWVSLP